MARQLHVDAEGSTTASPQTVWALVSDATQFSQWGPWSDGGYRPAAAGPSQPGAIQWFRYGRRTVSVEQILEVEAPRRLVYTVVEGLPVRNYRAEVTLTPAADGDGTRIRWAATWDATVLGRVVHRRLRTLYPEIVAALTAAADERAARERPT